MSRSYIPRSLRSELIERSEECCSYCQTAKQITGAELTVDHIIPESLDGETTLENLCLACWTCNLLKRDRIAAFDPETNAMARIFNPNRNYTALGRFDHELHQLHELWLNFS